MSKPTRDESEELIKEIEQMLMDEEQEPEQEHAEQPENIIDEEMERIIIQYAEELRKSRENTPKGSQRSQQHKTDSGRLDLMIDEEDNVMIHDEDMEIDRFYNHREDSDCSLDENELQVAREISEEEDRVHRMHRIDDDDDTQENEASMPDYHVQRNDLIDCLLNALEADKTEDANRKKAVYKFLGLYTLERLLAPYHITLSSMNQDNFEDRIQWIDENRESVRDQLNTYYNRINNKMNSVLRNYVNKYMKKDTNDDDLSFINKNIRDQLSEETIEIIKDKVKQHRQTIGEHFVIFCSQLMDAVALKYIFSYNVLPNDFLVQLSEDMPEYCGYPFIQDDYINAVLFQGFYMQKPEQIVMKSSYQEVEMKLDSVLETVNAKIDKILRSGLINVIKGIFSEKKILLIDAIQEILGFFNNDLLPVARSVRSELDEIDHLTIKKRTWNKRDEKKPKSTYKPVYNMFKIREMLPEIKDLLAQSGRTLRTLQKQNRKKK